MATDVLKEETSEDGSVEVIERRCKLNVDAPYLLKKVMINTLIAELRNFFLFATQVVMSDKCVNK